MTYPNDPGTPPRDPVQPNTPVPPGGPHYQEGYIEGRRDDERLFVDQQRARDNDSAARGLLMGVIIASLLGLGILAWYLLNQRDEQPIQQIIVPENTTSPTPPAPPAPDVDITIPSPQQSQAPAAAPDVDITIPSPQQSQAPAPDINNNITVPSPAPQSGNTPATPTGPSDVAPSAAPNDTTQSDTAPGAGEAGQGPGQ